MSADDADLGGEAPCWAHFVDDLDQPHEPDRDEQLGTHDDAQAGPVAVSATNTIVYCDAWADAVSFYRDRLGLRPTMERDWFVEFEIRPGAHISVADAARSTVDAGDGSGLTLSWQVADVETTRADLVARAVVLSPVRSRWGADTCFTLDPAGNRIEFWSLPHPT